MKSIIFIVIMLIILGTVPSYGFELPRYDPWFYQSHELGYVFQIPDKAQHYWGSALLNEIGKQLPLPAKKITSPLLALTAGFMYEVWQESNGKGFSERDLTADILGVITSQFSTTNLNMWMEYSIRSETITFNVGARF